MNTEVFEVIIVGGSYAGLSAGLVLGRSLRKVLIIDSGNPRNKPTPHSHSFLTRDGETPELMTATARAQVEKYKTVSFLVDKVLKANHEDDLIRVSTKAGKEFSCRKILIATGVVDQMLPIQGFEECWGKSILHCPYCHGYEEAGKRIGLIGNGKLGFDLVRLLYNWSNRLVLFTNGPSELEDEQRKLILSKDISIVETPFKEVVHTNGYLTSVLLADGEQYELDAIFTKLPFMQHSDLAQQLGVEVGEMGLLKASELGETNVQNVFVAGDNSFGMHQVVIAAASGAKVGIWINKELIEEDFV